MPREVEFAGAPAECKLLLERLHDHPGVARITLHSGASRVPQGDVLIIEAANQVAGEILNLFRELNLLHSGAVSISTECHDPRTGIPDPQRGRQRRHMG